MIASFEKNPAVPGNPINASEPDETSDPGNRHIPPQPAHVPHVLLMVHTDNDRTRREEQQRFEKRMGHQVKNSRRISGSAESDRHVTELR